MPRQAFVGADRSAVEIARKPSELLFMSREMKERAAARSDDSPGAGSLPGERIFRLLYPQKRTCAVQQPMSATGPIVDIELVLNKDRAVRPSVWGASPASQTKPN